MKSSFRPLSEILEELVAARKTVELLESELVQYALAQGNCVCAILNSELTFCVRLDQFWDHVDENLDGMRKKAEEKYRDQGVNKVSESIHRCATEIFLSKLIYSFELL